MKDGESIHDIHTRFVSIVNEIYSLGEIIPISKVVNKLLSIIPKSWERKVEVISETRDQNTLTKDDLIGNLKTYELKKISGMRDDCNP